jgi:hypothetical protein
MMALDDNPAIDRVIEVSIDPFSIPSILRMSPLTGNSHRLRLERGDTSAAWPPDARVHEAHRAGRAASDGVRLRSGAAWGREHLASVRLCQRCDVVELLVYLADEHPHVLGADRITAVARKGLEVVNGLGDRRFEA